VAEAALELIPLRAALVKLLAHVVRDPLSLTDDRAWRADPGSESPVQRLARIDGREAVSAAVVALEGAASVAASSDVWGLLAAG
jgi:hypothetical protein